MAYICSSQQPFALCAELDCHTGQRRCDRRHGDKRKGKKTLFNNLFRFPYADVNGLYLSLSPFGTKSFNLVGVGFIFPTICFLFDRRIFYIQYLWLFLVSWMVSATEYVAQSLGASYVLSHKYRGVRGRSSPLLAILLKGKPTSFSPGSSHDFGSLSHI